MKTQVEEILDREILRDIYNKGVFLIECGTNNLLITDAYDEWFDYELNKEKCLELAKVFYDLAKCFEDSDHPTGKGDEVK